MKRFQLLLLCVVGVSLSAADTPAECYYEDVAGNWLIEETSRDGDSSIACDSLGEVLYNKFFKLTYPNTVEDEFGNKGTWTMVYDQGFEVTVGGRSYFAFSYYVKDGDKVTSHCDKTFTGWARDLTVRNWSCFKGTKVGNTSEPRLTYRSVQYREDLASLPHTQDERFVDAINRHQRSWTAAIYHQFQGLSMLDMYRKRGGQSVRRSHASIPNPKPSLQTSLKVHMLPKEFDWRNVSGVNYVRPVKNQGNCGSCYAFASIGVVESQLLIRTNSTQGIDLSAEDVVGCSKLSQGCDGGFPYLIAGRYGQDVGLVSEQCIPYPDANISRACNHKRDQCRHVYTTHYQYVGGYFGGCNEAEMLLALRETGPLAVGIEVYKDFMHYKSGIYYHTGLPEAFGHHFEITNHAVLLVGYGETDDGEKYWIIQNSWGTSWGMDGYVLLRRGTDEIAVESMAVQVEAYP